MIVAHVRLPAIETTTPRAAVMRIATRLDAVIVAVDLLRLRVGEAQVQAEDAQVMRTQVGCQYTPGPTTLMSLRVAGVVAPTAT